MRQRPHVLHDVTLGTQDRVDPVTGVVDPELHRHRPLQHARMRCRKPPGGVRLRVPDGSEDLQHIGARDLRDRHLPDAWEGVPLEGQDLRAAVRPTSLAGLASVLPHARWLRRSSVHPAHDVSLRAGRRLAGQLAVGQRLFPGPRRARPARPGRARARGAGRVSSRREVVERS